MLIDFPSTLADRFLFSWWEIETLNWCKLQRNLNLQRKKNKNELRVQSIWFGRKLRERDHLNAVVIRWTYPFIHLTSIQAVQLCADALTYTDRGMYVNTECERENASGGERASESRTKKTDTQPTRSDSLRAVRSEQCNALCICTFLFTCIKSQTRN